MLKLVISRSLLALFGLSISSQTSLAGYWSEQELSILKSFQLTQLPKKPDHASNRFAYNEQAVKLGQQLFFDKRFSQNQTLSCASCHQPNKGFTDGLPKAKGVHKTGRNTQTLFGAVYQDWFYWDGRKDSLWAQALVPFEAADEMASSRVQVLRIIGQENHYRQQYESLFGKFPSAINQSSLKTNAGPWGDSETRKNWYRIAKPTKKIINRAYANIGKAVAAYERTITLPNTQFDDYLDRLLIEGDTKANQTINQNALAGMKLFIDQSKTHCMRCHNGPLFSNGSFHNIGSGNFKGAELDFGRFLGIQAVTQDEFNCLGQYSDAKPEECSSLRFLPKQVHGDMQGAFKTPTLRYLNQTGPYFHDGRFNTVKQVIMHYQGLKKGASELPPLALTDKEVEQLSAFIQLLN